MQGTRRGRGERRPKKTQQLIPLIQDELSDPFDASEDGHSVEKDNTELELEKLVFGDDVGFREGLRSYREANGDTEALHLEPPDDSAASEESIALEGEELDAVDDADLFFIDSGPTTDGRQDLIIAPHPNGEHDSDGAESAAWIDSDDERITVSLASNPRLRKLRMTESEDLVNGREYAKRLRQQFERLYPVPEWANPAASKRSTSKRKRRKPSDTASRSDESSSADDMSVDSDDLSAQPLAKLLQSTDSLTLTATSTLNGRKRLRPEVIDIQRTKDIGGVQPSAITSLSFHPHYPLLLSSGPASTLTLHHISPSAPSPNPTLTTLHIRGTPLTTSAFCPISSPLPTTDSPSNALTTTPSPSPKTRIFFSSRRRYFHIWDLTTGTIQKVSRIYGHAHEQRTMERFKLSPNGTHMALVGSSRKGGGTVNVLDAHTCQWVAQVRVEGRGGVADFDWWGDGQGLCVFGKGGETVEYDLRNRRVVARWIDEGAVGITVVALGGPGKGPVGLGGDRWCVVGSTSGIVNVYDRTRWRSGTSAGTEPDPGNGNGTGNGEDGGSGIPERPTPVRVLDQLTTPVSHLVFDPAGDMFVMTSRWKRDALRLVHLPSCTVYRNWPTSNTPFGRITAVALGMGGAMLAVANEQGRIRLWEIRS